MYLLFSFIRAFAAEGEELNCLNKAKRLEVKGKFLEALELYNQALNTFPESSQLYLQRGSLKAKLEYYVEAIKDYNKVIEMSPCGDAYNLRALARFDINDFSSALSDNNKALEFDGSNAEYYYNRALTKGKLGEYEGALRDFDKAINLNKEYAFAYLSRGYINLKMKNIAEAEKDIDYSIELDASNPCAYKYKALVLIEKKEVKEAVKFLKRANACGYSLLHGEEVNDLLKSLK